MFVGLCNRLVLLLAFVALLVQDNEAAPMRALTIAPTAYAALSAATSRIPHPVNRLASPILATPRPLSQNVRSDFETSKVKPLTTNIDKSFRPVMKSKLLSPELNSWLSTMNGLGLLDEKKVPTYPGNAGMSLDHANFPELADDRWDSGIELDEVSEPQPKRYRKSKKKSKKAPKKKYSDPSIPELRPKQDHTRSKSYPDPPSEILFQKGPPRIDLVQMANDGIVFDPFKGPSKLVTPDPDYIGVHYGIHKCKRSVSKATKRLVAKLYGVPEKDLRNYEVDHLIPLGLGGSNHPSNLWPQYRDANQKEKADLAGVAHRKLSGRQINQEEAIQIIFRALNREYDLTDEKSYP